MTATLIGTEKYMNEYGEFVNQANIHHHYIFYIFLMQLHLFQISAEVCQTVFYVQWRYFTGMFCLVLTPFPYIV